MAMTQSEIANLKKKIAAGTYTDDDILNDVAEGTYGVEVRRAIYAVCYRAEQHDEAAAASAEEAKEAAAKFTAITESQIDTIIGGGSA